MVVRSCCDTYSTKFRYAISQQPGFRTVRLFTAEDDKPWLLLIDFDSEDTRLKWVATAEHGRFGRGSPAVAAVWSARSN